VIFPTLYWQCAAEGHSDFLAACKRRAEGKLSLEHSGTDVHNSKLCDADGPYDVVILDMALTQLVLALMQVRCSLIVVTGVVVVIVVVILDMACHNWCWPSCR
jgi:hypothetical protein